MHEAPTEPTVAETAESIKVQKILLAREMMERKEVFDFPGIRDAVYAKIKQEEEASPEQAIFVTPIDELLARCKAEGIKVTLGAHPESGNVFVLPVSSEDIERDSLFPRQLSASSAQSDSLRNLIILDGGQE